LACNKANRMAFEYLMAYYLLNHDLDKFVANLPRMDDVGYTTVPRHWQEAVTMYEAMTGRRAPLGGRAADPLTPLRFGGFSSIVAPKQQSGDIAGARRAAAGQYGNTYFFYYVFGESGVASS
jgi:hypothetical protein